MIIANKDQIGQDRYVSNDYTIFDDIPLENDSVSPNRESNTRLDLVRRLDWGTWVGNGVNKSVIERLLDKYFGDEYDVKDYAEGCHRGAKPYDHEFKSANGSVLMVKEIKEEVVYDDIEVVLDEAKYEIILSLSGRPLAIHYKDNDLVTPVLDFIELTEMGLHPSRTDLKFIDYGKVLNLQELEKAGFESNYRGVRGYNPIRKYKQKRLGKSKRTQSVLTSYTDAFGSRESEMYYRFYMEEFVHNRDSYAYELEIKKYKARRVVELFIQEYKLGKDILNETLEEINNRLILLFNNVFRGGIDFIDRSQQCPHTGSLKKCGRLPFWQEFLNYIQSTTQVKLSVAKPKPTLKTTWNWLKRQAKGFINILKKGAEQIGVDYKILIDYLTVKDDEKMIYKPLIIQQDIGLKISELAVDGLSAIMTQDEINEFTDFAIASMYG